MKKRTVQAAVFSAATNLVCVASVCLASATVLATSDGGACSQIYFSSGSPVVCDIHFLWSPQRDPGSTVYEAGASCTRTALLGLSHGNNKSLFKKVRLQGLDSGRTVRLPTHSSKMRNGIALDPASWSLGTAGSELAVTDEMVLVTARVKTKGTVDPGDLLFCNFLVLEVDAGLLSSSSAAQERQELVNELIRAVGTRSKEIQGD
jgi:hypothetical protein